ncbi:MAG: hypothetical protein J6P71_02545 [Oscillospiraceae bacterium]|nr:hypothetical protein [Oscillospiraceae bacterium]
MKKRFFFLAVLTALALCLLAGCAKEPTAPKTPVPELGSDACISPLTWGMTREEAEAALAGYPITDSGKGFTFAAELFGQTVTAAAKFEVLSSDRLVVPVPEQTEAVLVGFDILPTDEKAFREGLISVLGEPLTHQVVYYDEAGVTGVKDGAELAEDERYWRSDVKLGDLFSVDELGKVDFARATDRVRYEDTRAWVVTTAPVDGKTAFVFNGQVLAIRAVLDKG